MNQTTDFIGVAPVGEAMSFAAEVIAAHISGYFNLPAECLPPVDMPLKTYDKQRLQYNAVGLLKAIEAIPFDGFCKVIAVLDVDIFIPIFTYVFGEARQGGKVALVSLFRLGKHPDGSSPAHGLVFDRASKVALHELGHLFGLLHCMDERCLMHFSGGVEEVDQTPLNLCRYCSLYLREAIGKQVGMPVRSERLGNKKNL